LLFCIIQADYAQIARHFWLNSNSYNHTLSPTSKGGYILAAAREERGVGLRNTIEVLELDQNYQILNTMTIGIIGGAGDVDGFDKNVNFEVHDVIENVNVPDNGEGFSSYVICGSMSRNGSPDRGMVAIVDAGLKTQSIRDYPTAEVFYSVYAESNYFYVCGKTSLFATGSNNGIVLRDDMFAMNPTAYFTSQLWEYHKIKLSTNGNDLIVSGTNWTNVGFTVFSIAGGNFAQAVNPNGQIISWSFPIQRPSPYQLHSNSKVVVANDPNNLRGLVLSFVQAEPVVVNFFSAEIVAYAINDYNPWSAQPPQANVYILWAFTTIFVPISLEDVNSAPRNSKRYPNGGFAWVLNADFGQGSITDRGMYFVTDLSFPLSTTWIATSWTAFSSYSRLHKVHYNPNDDHFHCGGYYYHPNNNDITTLVVSPEQLLTAPAVCYVEQGQQPASNLGYVVQPPSNSPQTIQMTIKVNSYPWHEVQYNFCDVDCDNSKLPTNPTPNCGN
jgi:hypothetical protein